ncbi:hypothetical protein [Nocardia exalbida]|uniref:hypothetical protein n=1 Tax=Nocardia exalbida TaxID=290231 RepID=UPI000593B899|nr:hypothetical protein [Nocardia exalbida]
MPGARAGRWLTRMDAEAIRARYGSPVVLHRADLVHILRSAIPAAALRTGVMPLVRAVAGSVQLGSLAAVLDRRG